MYVTKRNGAREEINLSKIANKVNFFTRYIYDLKKVDVALIVEQVKLGLHDSISTSEIDLFTARKCMDLTTSEPEYGVLASRILINNFHKGTLTGFKDKMEKLYRRKDSSGKSCPMINRTFFKFVCTNQRSIEAMIDYQRDYLLDTFGFLTLEHQYINRIDGHPVERPQDLFMKEAIALCMNTDNFEDKAALEEIWLVYDLLSTQKFTYATPTLNNSGMQMQQMSSCFLLGTEDSLEGINKTLDDAARISKYGGGIGIHVSNIRSAGQLIRGTNGKSSGICNFLKLYEAGANAYNQGGKRNGSFAIYLRDYHPDLMTFIQMKNPIGDDNLRARKLFFAVALSDLFWKTVEADGMWYFVDPEEHAGLDELYGSEFERTIHQLVDRKKYKQAMKARVILTEIMKQQFESGVPYIINIDHVNKKNNLSHYATVRSSNLCVEIMLPSSQYEYAVCNLSSLVLSSYVTDTPSNGDLSMLRRPQYHRPMLKNPQFDYLGLSRVVQVLTRTMDRVIDRNEYPVKEAMTSNLLHRPIGIGSSGFADVCCLMRIPYDSEEGVKLSAYIAETIAFAGYSESSRMAKAMANGQPLRYQAETANAIFGVFDDAKLWHTHNKELGALSRKTDVTPEQYSAKQKERDQYPENPNPLIAKMAKEIGVYPSYFYGKGAPISDGTFQWELWGLKHSDLSGMWDWDTLGQHIRKFGVRNSLITAQMPTATTAQIMGVNESVEPFTSNMYRRSVLSGEYTVFNKYLIADLIELGLWNEDLKNYLIASGGSIQNIDGIPTALKELYKTVWDMGQKVGVDHAAARGPFLDHSQSFNVFIGNLTNSDQRADKLFRTLYYGWKKGLKTGVYYLRSQPAIQAQQFSIPLETLSKLKEVRLGRAAASTASNEEQECLVCGT